MLRVEPVPPADRRRAVDLLVAGRRPPGRSAGFLALLSGADADRCQLWWARSLRGPRVAAMTVRNPGQTAMVFHSRPKGPAGVEMLTGVLRALTAATLRTGTVFVQVLLPPESLAEAEAYVRAGYVHLARLVYLRRGSDDLPPDDSGALTWNAFREGMEEHLGRVIADTYAESLDCPGLLGLRRMADVVAGHKCSGVFRPDGWFMPSLGGECVGCVLVNDVAGGSDEADVVYLGVKPPWRRRGVGRTMLRHALAYAAGRGLGRVSLAVDAANAPAVGLYQSEGFGEVDRKDCYIKRNGP